MIKKDEEHKQLVKKILLSMNRKELIEFAKRNGYISPPDKDTEDWKWDGWEYDYE